MLSALTGSLRWATGVGPASATGVGAGRRARTAANRHRRRHEQSDRDRGGQRADAGQRRSTIGGSHRGRHASTRVPERPTHPFGWRERGHAGYARSRIASTGATSRIDSSVIGSSTSWTWAMPSRAYARSVVGERLGLAGDRRRGGPAPDRPGAVRRRRGSRTRTATVRSTSRRIAPDRAAGVVDERAQRGHARRPRCRCRCTSRSRRRRAPSWRAASAGPSIRSSAAARPVAGRAAAARSRAPGTSARRSRSRRRAGGVRMIVNASSKRSMRWSNGIAEGAELGLVPARPEAQHEAAAAELVDRRGLLGEQRRVVEVRAGDERPELDPRRRGRDRRQQRPGLPRAAGRPVRPAVEEVLADPHRVEAQVLDRAGHVEQLGPADLALDLGELDADLERTAAAIAEAYRRRAGGRGSVDKGRPVGHPPP